MRSATLLAGRYLLERRAGAGGMGEVWKARDQSTGEAVAVKVLPGGDPEGAARFVREGQILAGLSHPGVVRYVAHGASAEGAPYLVMEWLDGEDLAARLARGPLSVDESVALAARVADVLGYAHAQGVIHRDLKPSNLFLPGGRLDAVKVLDFGIARLGHATRMTRSGVLFGSPGYIAPEQARSEAGVDARADVFSLGCVLFECLTGERAFGGQHAVATLTKVLFEDTPSARSARPEVPESLDELVQRMLAKQREERPSDGWAAAAELRALAPSLSDAPSGSSRSPSLTGSEQRAVAVILVSGAARPEPGSLDGSSTLAVAPEEATMLREAEALGGASERLADGSVVVMLAGAGLPTDLCAQAARCALSLRALAGGRRVALAMGRGERRGRSFGPAIDRAARLAEAAARGDAPQGAVVIDEVVAGLLDARFEVQEKEGSFSLHGERALARGARLLLGKATPCVGRDRELGTLRALFAETVEEGTAQAALVVAPPGVGKSRLAQEFVQELRGCGEDVAIWTARGEAPRAGSPLGMLGQALRSACGIREGEPLAVRRERLAAQVATWLAPGERQRVTEFLGELVGAPSPGEHSPLLAAARLDARLMADHVRAAFLDFVAAVCARTPVLVVLEDLHWGDKGTVQLLDAALRHLRERPFFVLAVARPEVRDVFPKLWDERRLYAMRLNELSRRAGERLARHVLGERADAEVIARIVRLSEGNAFYLEELIRWTAEGHGSDMPETVVAMVASRLAALDEASRRLLRAASVFGEVCWAGGVAALLGGGARRGGVMAGLAALVEREILVRRCESRFPGEEELAFRHALLREGAYAMLTEGDRTLGHRLAGEWLEARGEQDARALAEHFEKGGSEPAAARHSLRAAQQASWGGNAVEAVLLARRGLSLKAPDELRIRLLGALCEMAIWQLDIAPSLRREAGELMRAAPRGSAPWSQGVAARIAGAAVAGNAEEILAVAGELEDVRVAPDAAYPMTVALTLATITLDMMGRSPDWEALHAKLTAIARAAGSRSEIVRCFDCMAQVAREQQRGDAAGMLEHAKKGLALARQCGHRGMESVGSMIVALCLWCLGAADEAERMLQALPMADAELTLVSTHRPFILAWLRADRGEIDEARVLSAHLATSGRDRGVPLDEGRGRWVLAEVLRRAGALEQAEREIEGALELLSRSCITDVPGVLATKAALKLAQGKPVEALAAAEDGLARQAVNGHDHFFRGGAFLRLVHVESLVATGRHDRARAALADARARLVAIAARITDPARRTSFFEGVPENRRILRLARAWLGEERPLRAARSRG
ncbi:protein kinase [Sorangium cellulosum]|uniref:Protein kinase n=1 Tax=Sorangium cellulosum TaxID=56 RepID=A0A4P2Q0P7_SORCE|nr:serine/threonine-protein kinase [Sorangium cellulosum]AUX22476.1 protein kinase [Sorangium cellulosum]